MTSDPSATRYGQIAQTLRNRIQAGAHPVGSTLPSVAALADEFDVAEMTVKQALRILADEGSIATMRGVRARVLKIPSAEDANASVHQQLSRLRQRVSELEKRAAEQDSGHDTK